MKEELLSNIDKIHTTKLGYKRIKNNLNITEEDIISYCHNIILDKKCHIYREGKNWYCELNNQRLTINAYTYTIITAHQVNY